MTVPYDIGTVTLVNDSAAIVGNDTGWQTALVTGGVMYVEAPGNDLPIAVVTGEGAATAAVKWTGASGTYNYAIVRDSSAAASIVHVNDRLAQIVAKGVAWGIPPTKIGTLVQRDALDLAPEDDQFVFLVFEEDGPDVIADFYHWDGTDWIGPYDPTGPAGTGAPGSSDVVGTSTTSLAIGTGAKAFTIVEADRGWGVGARLRASSAADPANYMEGVVASYSGMALTLTVDLIGGSGTKTDWTINLAGNLGTAGANGVMTAVETIKTAAYTALTGDNGKTIILNKATADTLSFSAAATLGSAWMVLVKNIGAGLWTLDPNGSETIDGSTTLTLAQGQSAIVSSNGTVLRTILSAGNAGVLPKTAGYTATLADNNSLILCDATSGAHTQVLPTAASARNIEYTYKKTDTTPNAVTIDPNGSETIDGASTFVLNEQYEEVRIKSDGTAWHVVAYYAPRLGNAREVLTANRTYYVRTDGSGSNTGLVNSAGGAFLTLQQAEDAARKIDFNGFTVTISAGDGTYTGALTVGQKVGQAGPSSYVIDSTSGVAANVILSTSGSTISCVAPCRVARVELRSSANNALEIMAPVTVEWDGTRFGACSAAHIHTDLGGVANCVSNYSIVGAATYHHNCGLSGTQFCIGRTVTLTGTPAFSGAFIRAHSGGAAQMNANTYSGSATGKRYDAFANGVIQTFGAGTTYFPGNVAGTSGTTGGEYA